GAGARGGGRMGRTLRRRAAHRKADPLRARTGGHEASPGAGRISDRACQPQSGGGAVSGHNRPQARGAGAPDPQRTLEARVAQSLEERKVLADVVEGMDAFVQVLNPKYRWLAINGAAAREFRRVFGVLPNVGDCMLDLLSGLPAEQAAVRTRWRRAL